MTGPRRVQLSRAAGWRMPDNTVSVARPTRWGNPHVVGSTMFAYVGQVKGDVGRYGNRWVLHDRDVPFALTAEQAVQLYRHDLEYALDEKQAAEDGGLHVRAELLTALETLRGKNLACWCPPDQPCHADVLLEFANQPEET